MNTHFSHEEVLTQQIRKAQAGDSQAMIALLEQFEPLVRAAVALRYPKGQEGEDLLQEAYIALLRAILQYDHGPVSFPYYAKRMVYGATWSYKRKALRISGKESPDSVRNEDGELLSVFARIPDEHSAAAFQRPELESYLTPLSPRERLVILEVVIGGMPMAELARREGVSLDTVKVWKKRAFAKIRKLVQTETILPS